MRKRASVESVAEAYLELLAARRVDYFFGNAGTDFAPLIEAYAKREAQGQVVPRPITVPHEIPAVGHGPRLRDGDGAPPGRDGPRHRGNGQRAQWSHQRLPQPGAGAHDRRTHADHRGRRARRSQPPHPLGPGVVRSGRHGARVREVGLRAAHGQPARDGGGPRAGHRSERPGGAGLPHAASRGARRASGGSRVLRSLASGRDLGPGRRPGRHRGGGASVGRRPQPHCDREVVGPRSCRGGAAGRAGRDDRPAGLRAVLHSSLLPPDASALRGRRSGPPLRPGRSRPRRGGRCPVVPGPQGPATGGAGDPGRRGSALRALPDPRFRDGRRPGRRAPAHAGGADRGRAASRDRRAARRRAPRPVGGRAWPDGRGRPGPGRGACAATSPSTWRGCRAAWPT